MPKQTMFRQGDVLLLPVSAIPAAATPRPATNGLLTLAYGEVTGHHHSIAASPSVALLDVPMDGQVEAETYLTVEDAVASLTHQEHATLNVPVGIYKVLIQQQYQRKAVVRVLD